jgi:hypothetical protein
MCATKMGLRDAIGAESGNTLAFLTVLADASL